MGDEFEWGILTGIDFSSVTNAFMVFCDIFRRDGFAKSNPIDRSIDGVAD
jgi:hypothetical protein